MMAGSTREIEVKLPYPSEDEARRAVESLGATLVRARHFEDNVAFDDETSSIVGRGMVLRLRRNDRGSVVTMKCPIEDPASGGKHKVRDELETTVSDPEAFQLLLDRLGFTPCYRYQKYRTVFALDDLEIVLDETPIGCFVELEGPPVSIDRVAARLGFTPDRYVRDSYRELQQRLAPAGTTPGDMLME